MTGAPRRLGKELLETFYLIVQEYRTGAIDDAAFKNKIFTIVDRYAISSAQFRHTFGLTHKEFPV